MFHKAILATTLTASLTCGAIQTAHASPFTNTSPVGGGFDVTTVGASTVGGIVVDILGLNNARVISQLAASSLFEGFFPNEFGTIGTQSGFGPSVTNALGGGLQAAAFRFTLYDGDNGPGNFDDNRNFLFVNGIDFGNWSDVVTERTDNTGTAISSNPSGGFRNNLLDTGWFHSTNTSALAQLFTTMTNTQQLVFQVRDLTPNDNYYDFTLGINASLINVGQAPVVTQPPTVGVPEPASLLLLSVGLIGASAARYRLRA